MFSAAKCHSGDTIRCILKRNLSFFISYFRKKNAKNQEMLEDSYFGNYNRTYLICRTSSNLRASFCCILVMTCVTDRTLWKRDFYSNKLNALFLTVYKFKLAIFYQTFRKQSESIQMCCINTHINLFTLHRY